ncbi:MAG: hypothetical protein SFX19_04480 [Alphaproteobacteria bacterium]|nr:hypothetical protein [Alphaproteobacteria bacterium]
MILPLGAISPDTGYQFPNFYGIGYGVGGRIAPRQPVVGAPPPVKMEVRDMVILSPAAQRIMDQAERLQKIQPNKE